MVIKVATKTKLDNGVTFTFADKAQTTRTFDLKELSKQTILDLAIHGLSQKGGDSYSGCTSTAEAISAIDAVWANLKAGNFNARVSGSSLFIEALARIKGLAVEEVRAKVEAMDEAEIDKIKANGKVKATMTVIRGERASKIAISDTEDELFLG